MRWKIIIVNAGIAIVVALLTYVLLATSLKDVVANQAERKREVAQALRAANAQLALATATEGERARILWKTCADTYRLEYEE